MAQVNNAAQAIIKPTMECTAEDYSRLMATNLGQLAHPLLRNSSIAGGGSIVHISSIASVMAFQEVTIYSIAKGTMRV
jgi:Tropinone reductase 1